MFGLAACGGVRVLIVEDEPYMAEAIRDGLRLEAIAADIAGDGERALELLRLSVRLKVALRRGGYRI
jgi:DNA-binding response OmpR family regulator